MVERILKGTAEVTHPLLERKIISVLWRWQHWKDAWDREMTREEPCAEVLIGLLDFIFSVPGSYEKICFLLEIADGYRFGSNFPEKENGQIYDPRSDCWVEWNPGQEVAKRAWSMLCNFVFQNTEDEFHNPSWVPLVTQERICNHLLQFFDPEGDSDNIPYLHDAEHDSEAEIVIVFLLQFVRFAKEFRSFGLFVDERDRKVSMMFSEARPRLKRIAEAAKKSEKA